MIKIIKTQIEFNMKWIRISDTDYIEILLSKWDFFIMCLWFEAENEKRKEKNLFLHGTLVRSFDRFSFYMYYKMAKRRERRIWHMVFRWINVWKSNVYWPHYVKSSFFNYTCTCIKWRRIKIDLSWCRNWYSVKFKKWNNLKHVLIYLKSKIGREGATSTANRF